MNKKLKTTNIYPLKFWVWEITVKLSEEIFLFRSIGCSSIVYSDYYNDFSQSSYHVDTPHGHTRKKEDSKISRKNLIPPH